MTPTRQGSFRLFRLWGIDVHLHWSWFVLAVYSVSTRVPRYHQPVWALLEYLTLFLIVLMHEFGHALASRQVGGQSDQIVLWPFGGVAYVAAPSRPGATLWSIAAGPLVNVVLFPILAGVLYFMPEINPEVGQSDLEKYVMMVFYINAGLLIFNLLPIYPLDGGQILRSLLWYPLGKARSLFIATILGFLGGAGLAIAGLLRHDYWLAAISVFLLSVCWRSFKQAQVFLKVARLPRHPEFACPSCRTSPPVGNYWPCNHCGQPFDPFATRAICPHCHTVQAVTPCVDCGTVHAFVAWDKSIRDV